MRKEYNNVYEIFENIKKMISSKYNIDIDAYFEKNDNYVFIIPLHKISSQTGKNCEEISTEIFNLTNLKGEIDNCFLKFKYNHLNKITEIDAIPSFLKNKKFLVEFSSPNIAKPFNVGHLRSTILGDVLSRLIKHTGGKVIKVNYLGDWGVQFGKLIYAYKKYGNDKELSKKGIRYLFELYVRIHKDEEKNEEVKRYGEEEFIKLEKRDKENLLLWKKFYNVSIKEFEKIYSLFDISFDVYDGESKKVDKSQKMIEKMLKKKIAFIDKDKSIVINTPFGNLVIQKKGERTLYATRDLVAALERCNKEIDEIIYVVGNEQKDYFQKIFYVAHKAGCNKKLTHVDFGLLYLPTGKFSTRKGNVIFVEDLINEIKKEIKKQFSLRRKNISDKKALYITISTIKFAMFSQARRKNFSFDMKKFTSFNNENAIYLLYTYTRILSLIKTKKGYNKVKAQKQIANKEEAQKVMNFILKLPFYIDKTIRNYDPHYLITYSIELCQKYNSLYQNIRFIGNPDFEDAGIYISIITKNILKKIFNIFNIKELKEI